MKIVSLLPSATEIVCALGLGDCLVGVTHECDYPPEVTGKPVLTASRIHSQALTSVEIDHAVSTRLGGHQSLYTLDEERLAALRPDLVLTQELCAVCAVSYADVQTAARVLNVGTRVVSLEPTTFEEVFGTIELVGRLTDRVTAATELVASLRARVAAVRALSPRASGDHGCGCVSGWSRPTRLATGCPPRWKPQRMGVPSTRVTPEEIVHARPEVIVLAPCGFHADEEEREAMRVNLFAGWNDLPAVRAGEVWAVDASSYYSRPGPRLVGGVELMASTLHPEIFGVPDRDLARRVNLGRQNEPALHA